MVLGSTLGFGAALVELANVDTLEAEQQVHVLAGHRQTTILVGPAGVGLHALAVGANVAPRTLLATGRRPRLLLVVSKDSWT